MAETFDIVVIGSGPGGYVAAIRAAQLGFKTACIEKDSTCGGTCLNVGCIPSKALLQSSEHYNFLKHHASEHGIATKEVSIDFKHMMERKEGVVKTLVTGIAGLFKRNHVTLIKGEASFTSPNTLSIKGNAEYPTVTAKQIILATGSAPFELPFLPFDEKKVLSSTGALSLEKTPKKLLVVGAGVIGVELASVYSRLGSEIEVFEMLDHICPGVDKEIGRSFQKILTKQGLSFHLGAQVMEADTSGKGVTLKVRHSSGEEKSYNGDCVLVSIGRRPYTDNLNLEKVGVQKTKRGSVIVDNHFRTSIPHIFAIGDIVEGAMLAHRASEEGIALVEWLAGNPSKIHYTAIPSVIYTHPEVAGTGLTEEEGKELRLNLLIGRCSLKANPRARCAGDTDGLVKVIGDKASGRLLGVHILSPHASEMIGEAVVALEEKMSLKAFAAASHAHPTIAEAIKEAAMHALGSAIHL